MREELGVNRFTSPSTVDILDALRGLSPLPEGEKPKQPKVSAHRGILAMRFGVSIADGFLIAATENQSGAEAVARSLMQMAKALAVSSTVTRHAESLSETVARRDWDRLAGELSAMQGDIEKALMELRDEEIAHLIAFGGWVRAMEICGKAVDARYSPARSARLLQPELMDYFLDRLGTLQPVWKDAAPFASLRKALAGALAIVNAAEGDALTKKQVKALVELAGGMTSAIVEDDR